MGFVVPGRARGPLRAQSSWLPQPHGADGSRGASRVRRAGTGLASDGCPAARARLDRHRFRTAAHPHASRGRSPGGARFAGARVQRDSLPAADPRAAVWRRRGAARPSGRGADDPGGAAPSVAPSPSGMQWNAPGRLVALALISPAGARTSPSEWDELLDIFKIDSAADARRLLSRLYHRAPWYLAAVAPELRDIMKGAAVRDVVRSATLDNLLMPASLSALEMPILLLWGQSERLLPPARSPISDAICPRTRSSRSRPDLVTPRTLTIQYGWGSASWRLPGHPRSGADVQPTVGRAGITR